MGRTEIARVTIKINLHDFETKVSEPCKVMSIHDQNKCMQLWNKCLQPEPISPVSHLKLTYAISKQRFLEPRTVKSIRDQNECMRLWNKRLQPEPRSYISLSKCPEVTLKQRLTNRTDHARFMITMNPHYSDTKVYVKCSNSRTTSVFPGFQWCQTPYLRVSSYINIICCWTSKCLIL